MTDEEKKIHKANYAKAWRVANPEKVRRHRADYYSNHAEELKAKTKKYMRARPELKSAINKRYNVSDKGRATSQTWRRAHGEELRKRERERRARISSAPGFAEEERIRNKARYSTEKERLRKVRQRSNPIFKLRENLRSRLARAVRSNQKAGSAVRDLGCSILQFKSHIEAQFRKGMDWSNWGLRGWHLDHIRPLSGFDLSKREELQAACHYTNIQPLWWFENMGKGNRQ